ncbi:hypothetical protein PR048_014065 [Dryococelus australis]|uniref:Uncharacterized protein n=1 Tax=Dryococelus australis TaxID=614101 RepID=A0ABQ9HTY4_9NEOP|nr:hypothetical protein PR048_014065 [Dryococelus australis]
MCCDTIIAKCMLSECDDCMSDVKIILGEGCNYDKKLKWKKIENKAISAENCTTLHKIASQLNSLLPGLKHTVLSKELKSAYFATCKESLINLPNKVVMQIDFAENYTLTEQDAIQSHYLSKHQVTIFTCYVWHLDKVYSFDVISDDLRHSKVSVRVFMQHSLLFELKKIAHHVDQLFVFSNNCAGQFKNRYTCSNVCFPKMDFYMYIEWNIFAARHGKGAVDGVEGSVKRTV